MKESPIFTATCEAIEEMSDLSRLEARGTVRLAMKAAGLEVHDVTSREMLALLNTLMPRELEARAVADVEKVIEHARGAVKAVGAQSEPGSAEQLFETIAGRLRR